MSQLFSIWSHPSYIDPSMIGKPNLAPSWGPEADDETDDGRDSETGEDGEGSEDGDISELDSECGCLSCYALEVLPPAFSSNGRLRDETSRWPAGGIGRRDMTHVGGLPIEYGQLAEALNSIAATWLCDEMKQSPETEGSLESKIEVVRSMNSSTKRVERVWKDLERELQEARKRGVRELEHAQSRDSLASATRQDASTTFANGSPVMVLKGLHSADSDRHSDVISFLRSMSQKMLNGWQKARIARLDVTGGEFDRLRPTDSDTNERSSDSVKRARPAGEGSAEPETTCKRAKNRS